MEQEDSILDSDGNLLPLPGIAARGIIRQGLYGKDKIDWLDRLEEAHRMARLSPEQREELSRTWETYNDKLYNQKPIEEDPETLDKKMTSYIKKAFYHKPEYDKPPQVTYDAVRKYLWQFFVHIVYRETGQQKVVLTGNQAETLRNLAHWINRDRPTYTNGQPDPSGPQWDPDKSVYIFGPKGVGKTSIVEAGAMVTEALWRTTRYKACLYKMRSLEELYINAYSKNNVDLTPHLSGNLALDEFSERHLDLNYYGNNIQFALDLLTVRHNIWKRDKKQTIITSNLDPHTLEEVLQDSRLMDRFNQQYTFWGVVADNYRA